MNNGIDAMVSRFLCWRFPDDFAPDGGISFKPIESAINPEMRKLCWPIGTNLLNAVQAKAMLEHVVGTPAASSAGAGDWRKILLRLLDLGQDVHQVAPALGGEMIEQVALLRLAIVRRLESPIAGGLITDDGSLTYVGQRKVVEHMTTELGAAIAILQNVQQRAEAIDCHPIAGGREGEVTAELIAVAQMVRPLVLEAAAARPHGPLRDDAIRLSAALEAALADAQGERQEVQSTVERLFDEQSFLSRYAPGASK